MDDPGSATPPEALLRQAGFLRALARGLVGEEHASDDVVQATWLAALERERGELRRPRAWLARVARNLALDRRRELGRRAARERAAARPEALAPPSEALEREEVLRSVTDAVLALDEPYRTTILLRYFEGLELAEIAARRREPVATVRSRHARALARLRERLDRRHGGDRGAWLPGLVALVGGERAGIPGPASSPVSTNGPVSSAGPAGAAGGIGATGVTAGALIMTTKLQLTLALAVALVALTALWLGGPALFPGAPREDAAAAPALARLVAPEADAPPLAAAPPSPREAVAPAAEHAAPPGRGSLRVRAWWSDGTPAAGEVVKAHPWGAADPFLASSYATLDEHGEALFQDLPPGKVGIYPQRSGFAQAQVEAGAETLAELTIAAGLEVRGRVVDLDGSPVPGAEIWLSDGGNSTQGAAVATSDAAGRFRLRDVSDQNAVCAHAVGYAPSPSFWIQGSVGDVRELELVLQGPGAALAVRVVGPDGEPLAGARVHVREQGSQREGYAPEAEPERSIPYLLATDERGSCLAPSLLSGTADVVVGASGLAPWKGTVELAAGATQALEVALLGGAAVRGVVRGSDGQPLAGVTVRAGRYADLDSRETRSAADGSYRLAGLAPGAIELSASARGAGRDAVTLAASDGDELEWDPVIEAGRVLHGRLVDERGQPLAGWGVDVGSGPRGVFWLGGFHGQAETDEEGRFRIVSCPDEPLWLTAVSSRFRVPFAEVELDGLRPGDEERLVEVRDAQLATGWITGRTLGPDGRPASVQLTLQRADRGERHAVWSEAGTGAFRLGPLSPATYSLAALGQASESLHVDGLELAAGETLELGSLRLGSPGRIEIVLLVPEGVAPEQVEVSLLTHERVGVRTLSGAQLAGPIEVPSGRYLLEVSGWVLPERVEVSVAPGETARVELAPLPGVRVALHFRLPAERDLPLELELVFRPDGGGEPFRTEAYLLPQPDPSTEATGERSSWALPLVPPASGYTLEVTGPDGLTGSAVLGADVLRPASEPSLPVELVLR